MLAILNSLNAQNFPIVQRTLMILVSKFMVHRAPVKRILKLGDMCLFNMLVYCRLKAPRYEAVPPRSGGAMQQLKILPAVSNCQSSRVEGLQLDYCKF